MEEYIVNKKVVEQRDAIYSQFPKTLLPKIQQYLISNNINKLYCHQAEMFDKVCNGENIVITTSTASGKTLSFLLPVLQEILKNPSTRALFIYPTKALASDQFRAMMPILDFFGKNKISAGIYDGDTPVNERSRIRNSANIILTNPEMVNSAFLPNHSNYGFDFIFSNLKFVVIDELHTYKGAFGSHLANVFKRLNRICKYYNTSPKFLCSSATIANPIELAENICSKKFTLVNKDGSPAPKKNYYIIQPPVLKGTQYRVSVSSVSAELIPELILKKKSLIAFCKSRKAVEVVLKESRDKLKYDGLSNQDFSNLVSGYRGGYTPLERKEIERKMVSGEIKALVSTNALELGIDIGKIDTTILTGFPNTRASFWQQSGRAGRNGKTSDTFLILDYLPFDQYIAIDPDWLYENGSENAIVDKNNLFIQLAHIRAASAELALSLDDISIFPDLGEIIPVLLKAYELKSFNGKFIWNGKEFPAGDYSLRNMDMDRYKLVNIDNGKLISEMDEMQAFRSIHNGAIYMHDGTSFQVINLDLESRTATAKEIDDNYYTEPFSGKVIEIIKEQNTKQVGRTSCYFGDVNVTNTVGGFKKLQFHNHQNLGFEHLDSTLSKTFETEGIWIEVPPNVCNLFLKLCPDNSYKRDGCYRSDYFEGLGFSLVSSAMMTTMTTREDVDYERILDISEDSKIGICIYDLFVGGLGYAEKSFEMIDLIVKNAIKRVDGCKCKNGCPACVGDFKIDKKVILWALKSIYNEVKIPSNLSIIMEAPVKIKEKLYKLEYLEEHWDEFTKFIITKGEYLANFCGTIKEVKVQDNKLLLKLDNEFYINWINDKGNKVKLFNMITSYVAIPSNFEINFLLNELEIENDNIEKILKRFSDLGK